MKDLNLYAKELVDVVNYLMKKNQLVFSRNNKEYVREKKL